MNNSNITKPAKEQIEWSQCEIGAIIHLDIPIFEPEYEFRSQWGYTPSPLKFNPRNLDTDQWVKSIKDAGANYIVLVAKHCSGFCLWPTEAYEYSVKNTPWNKGKGDIVGDFFASCKKYGIKPGLYYSSSCNAFLNVDNPGTVRNNNKEDQEKYNTIVIQQLTELWTKYGDVFEIWFDGGCLPVENGGPDVISLLNKLQPNAVVFQGPENTSSLLRWVGNERGFAPFDCWSTINTNGGDNYDGTVEIDNPAGDPLGNVWSPAESDVPIRDQAAFGGGWFWKANEDNYILPHDHLVDLYYKSVGRNSNLLLGVVIDDTGLVPQADVSALKSFGDTIKETFKNKLYDTNGEGCFFDLNIYTSAPINNIVIMENIKEGQRILNYEVVALCNDKWTLIESGKSIGYKRIIKTDSLICEKLRFTVLDYKDTPLIDSFSAY